MGRGGTKFESEAIGVRSGRQIRGPSFKDMKKEMEAGLLVPAWHNMSGPNSGSVCPSQDCLLSMRV